jgi:hypothetical protein
VNASREVLLVVVVVGGVHKGQVQVEVLDGAEEVVLVDEPLGSAAAGDVDIRVDKSDAREVVAAADDRDAGRIANKLRVEVLDDGSADDVDAGREVDDSTERGG